MQFCVNNLLEIYARSRLSFCLGRSLPNRVYGWRKPRVRRTQKAARPGGCGILHKTAARIKGPGSEVCCRARDDLKMTYESSVFMEALSCSVISSASLLVGAFAV